MLYVTTFYTAFLIHAQIHTYAHKHAHKHMHAHTLLIYDIQSQRLTSYNNKKTIANKDAALQILYIALGLQQWCDKTTHWS